ncbi:hypothetical protein AAW14_28670 [Streptomyces hygroscopicus]|uniref:hypothetical protein n=1 Tax=Streptomyces hygroscopicus TaxID=1912 RepID=UPI00223FFEDB|nr:hypothetical protein [Streptomyces hygroscopicus]MCW7945870.1 hypothetical protein [Streptomyces hygroscopicus]
MRVLFTARARPSHLSAPVPPASVFRDAGHEVLIVGQPALLGPRLPDHKGSELRAAMLAGPTPAQVGADPALTGGQH